ncbi:prepilin-type N-terminal cleavage/methylation domain-containing protein [Psychrobacter sp. AH5]|uniref:type II secretion system protein GspJ n=1 Tax=Psychrobacter sp. AH5 TaxID=2937433 RepID=UPI00333EEFDD
MNAQRGFTLLELMVAMAIFAMLAVAGWQVFDSVNRARERAQLQADNLAVLQYAYLQLQQDMSQIIAYQAPNMTNATTNTNTAANNASNNNADGNNVKRADSAIIAPEPFMRLDSEQMSFVRFADPDPRYQSSPSLQRIEYVFAGQRLIRRQYTNIQGGSDSVSLDSVLLEGVSALRWQALLPELANRFPDKNSNNNNSNTSNAATAASANEVSLLPKGVAVSFTYQDMPITWQWSLAPQPLALNTSALNNGSKTNTDSSGNNNNSQNNTNNSANNQSNSNNSGSSN